jgi:hypothetical protein
MHIAYRQKYIFMALLTGTLLIFTSSCMNRDSADDTQPGSWGTAELIETNNASDIDPPKIAMDGDGNAIAVLAQYDGTQFSIYANYFNGTSWGTAELIDSEDDGNSYAPQIAMDGAGNAIAVWQQYDGAHFSIYANYFNDTSWGTAELIENNYSSDIHTPQIVMDSAGNAIAVWQQYDGAKFSIYASYFNGTSWGTAKAIDSVNAGDCDFPQISIDDSGNAVAVWQQYDGSLYSVYANYFNGTSWGTAEAIDSVNAGDSGSPQISIDDSGNAVAVWQQYDGSLYSVYANYFNGTSWGTAEAIDSVNAGDSGSPQISIDDSGNAAAVWQQFDGTRFGIYTNYFNGTSWSTAGAIDSIDGGNAYYPEISMNSAGNAIAVWSQFDGFRYRIWANYFDGTSWGTVDGIDCENAGSAYYPEIVMDDNGNAIAVWQQFNSTQFSIYANRFK